MGAHSFIQSLAAAGTIALQTFFLMSGFLITVLLVREWERHGRIDIRKFYVRRALRLLPALVLFIGVSCVLVAWTLPEYAKQEHYKAAIAALFYFYNWGFIYNWFYAGFLSHCWSLAVEEQFYLFWPALLIVLLRLPLSRLWKLAIVASGVTASAILRAILLATPNPVPWRVLLGTDMHADSLLLGCLIGLVACWGLLPQRPHTIRIIRVLAFGSVLFLTWHVFTQSGPRAPQWNPQGQGYDGQVYRVIAIGCMFLTLVTSPPRLVLRVLEDPLIVWFGRRSYGIYLWHLGINGYFLIRFHWPEALIAPAGALLGVAIGAASFRWVETPFLRLKTHFVAVPEAREVVRAQTARTRIN